MLYCGHSAVASYRIQVGPHSFEPSQLTTRSRKSHYDHMRLTKAALVIELFCAGLRQCAPLLSRARWDFMLIVKL